MSSEAGEDAPKDNGGQGSGDVKEDLYPVRLFISSTSVNYEIKQQQQRAVFVLESKKIPFEQVDVAKSKAKARIMRATVGDPAANPPRFFKGEMYLGGFKEFSEAVDGEVLEEWLHLKVDNKSNQKKDTSEDSIQHLKHERLIQRFDRAAKH